MDSVEGAEGILFQVLLSCRRTCRPCSPPGCKQRQSCHTCYIALHFLPHFRLPLCICACSQCAETLSEEVLGKMHAPPKNEAVPVIDTHKLPEADGAFSSVKPIEYALAQACTS